MTQLLITGSRAATVPMLEYAWRVVSRAKTLGWSIIVGDAGGVDAGVVRACRSMRVPFACYGIKVTPRNGAPLALYHRVATLDYLRRDRVMAAACDRCIGIWNGQSLQCGTVATCRYALEAGKPTDLMDLSSGFAVMCALDFCHELI